MSSERAWARAPLASSTTARSSSAARRPAARCVVVDVGADDEQRDGIGQGAAVGLLVLEARGSSRKTLSAPKTHPCQRSGSACTDR